MANKEQLFEQMTSIGMVYVILSQITQWALNQALTEEKLAEEEEEARRISGMNGDRLSERSFLAPLIESFFSEMKRWLKTKDNGPAMVDFMQMFNAETCKTFEERYELNQKEALPRWHEQVLEVGSKMMQQEKVSPEQIGSLCRNIPGDTTVGYLAIEFLTEALQKSPNQEKLSMLWGYLSGEKPFLCRVKQSGLFSCPEFLPTT